MFNIYINNLLFVYYPYIAITVFVLGSFLRNVHLSYGWRAGSTQIFNESKSSKIKFIIASNFFHIGIIFILIGHFVGLLTPHEIYSHFIEARDKQILAVVSGGIAGVLCLIGLVMLIHRRLTNPRIASNTSIGDYLILYLLLAQLILGLISINISINDDENATSMINLANYVQNLVMFSSETSNYIIHESIIFKAHIFLGFTIFLVFPFSKLVHIWSVPIGYITRKGQQIMRRNN